MKHAWYSIGEHTKKCKQCGLEAVKSLIKIPSRPKSSKLITSFRTKYYYPETPTRVLERVPPCK